MTAGRLDVATPKAASRIARRLECFHPIKVFMPHITRVPAVPSTTLGIHPAKPAHSRRRTLFAGLFLCLPFLLAGCASVPPKPAADNRVTPGFVPPKPGALVMLLPPEKSFTDLVPGQAMMTEQLHRQLVAAGYRTALLEKANHDAIWRQEVEAVGGVFDPATGARRNEAYFKAMANLARRVCAEAKCALLVQHQLMLREAKLHGLYAEWDGQRREIPVTQSTRELRFKGGSRALSVGVNAIMADGTPAFRTFGGAALPMQVDVDEAKQTMRKDLFANDAEIADGVRIALAPLREP